MRAAAPNKILPPSPSHSVKETNKKYMQAIAKIKNTTNPPMYINLERKVPAEEKPIGLPENHPFKSANYIVEYMKKGTHHLTIVLLNDDTHHKA